MAERKNIPNPTGKNGRDPKAQELRTLARTHTEDAVNMIVSVMNTSDDAGLQLEAACMLLDRAWGKPSQAIDLIKYDHDRARALAFDESLPDALRLFGSED